MNFDRIVGLTYALSLLIVAIVVWLDIANLSQDTFKALVLIGIANIYVRQLK